MTAPVLCECGHIQSDHLYEGGGLCTNGSVGWRAGCICPKFRPKNTPAPEPTTAPEPDADQDRLGRDSRTPGAGVPYVLSVPSEDALFELLTALNNTGIMPELPCVYYGRAFLAGLTDPDVDHVVITNTDESGNVHCCDCAHPGETPGEFDTNSWRPGYPVLALVTEWPDQDRAAEDGTDVWWRR